VKSTVEPLEGNKVKVSVTVGADEFESEVDAAWKQLAREARVPGFRAGKVPRKVLEARIDPLYARSEAIQHALPEYYVKALREHRVDVIAQPEFDLTAGEDEGDVTFDAVVEVRPEIALQGYGDLTIEIPSPHPSDDDIADQIDRLRGQYGEINTVERPAVTGDYVSIDITGSRDGEAIDGLTADDYLYEVGAGNVVPELDDNLRATKPGDIIEFDAEHPDPSEDGAVHFRVLVKEVKERVLPDLDDEWVAEATEFETVDALRDDTISRLTKVRKAQASMAVQARIGDKLADLVTDDVPDALVNTEMRARLEDLVHRLSHQGLTLDQYLTVTGTDPQAFTDDLRQTAEQSAKVDLALRAIASAEELGATDDDVTEELDRLATMSEVDPDQLRSQLEEADRLVDLEADLSNRKALRWLTDNVTILDEGGNPVSRDELELDDESDDDHDHDHDHDHDDDHDDDHDHDDETS
jgi:trigger factor